MSEGFELGPEAEAILVDTAKKAASLTNQLELLIDMLTTLHNRMSNVATLIYSVVRLSEEDGDERGSEG